jgi:transcriptional regulator GlxA family with amidase domain
VLIFNSALIADSSNAFDYEYLAPFAKSSLNFKNRLPGNDRATARIAEIMAEIHAEYKTGQKGYRLMIKSLVLQILTLMVRSYADTDNVPEPLEERKRKLGRIDDAITYIKEHFTEELTLAEVADVAAMSTNYFSGYFREATGFSFVEYISRLRVYRANALIRETERTMLDVAADCGFNNVSNFYRTYKKILGESPGKRPRQA